MILDNKQYFFTDGRYIEQSKNQVKNATIIITGSAHYSEIKSKNLLNDNMTIGFESDYVSVNLFSQFKQQLNKIKWIPTSGIIEKIAAVKDRLELNHCKQQLILQMKFLQIIPDLKEGAVEKEIAAKISYLFKMNGAEGDSYEPIIGSGYLGALPHARPSSKQFEKGDFVVMDFGALYNGYHADMTRTVAIGEATSSIKKFMILFWNLNYQVLKQLKQVLLGKS